MFVPKIGGGEGGLLGGLGGLGDIGKMLSGGGLDSLMQMGMGAMGANPYVAGAQMLFSAFK